METEVDAFERPDGRSVVVHRVGPPSPAGVVLFHSTPGCGAVVVHAAEAAVELGLTVVACNRPGYGGTSTADRSFSSAVEDAVAAADHYGMQRIAVLGLSGGAAFAAALSAAKPGRVAALGISGGIGDWRAVDPSRANWEPIDVEALELAEQARRSEAVELLRSGCSQQFQALLELPDADLAVALTPRASTVLSPQLIDTFQRRLVREMREALTTFDGLIYDNLTLNLPWEFDPGSIRAPSWLWYGTADQVVPIENGRWYERVIPRASLVVLDGEGHAETCLGHWQEILPPLARAVA